MTGRRNLLTTLALACVALAAMAFTGLSTALADACTVTVTVVGGQTYTFNVNVPPGTPISQMSLPVNGVVASESETCAPPSSSSSSTTTPSTTSSPSSSSSSSSPSSTTSSSTSTSRSSSSSTSSTTSSSSSAAAPGRARGEKPSNHPGPATAPNSAAARKPHARKPAVPKPAPGGQINGAGVPLASTPTFSLSLPGPAQIGVPNFFIDSFRIPPFLLPIYQAAGIEYDVPWQVLASINEIETDYGRNLSVSTAGAVGWMQFLPSTWKHWGVDANGDGVADPYNPVDAIFTAARYLHAAGASQNLGLAIFAYNHADWYVQSVLLRAKLIGGIPGGLIGALSGLVQGHFPVNAPAKYADDSVLKLARTKVARGNAAITIGSDPNAKGTPIFAQAGSRVIAANDGRIVRLGTNAKLGRFIVLQDATGNTYTYAHLGSIVSRYAVPRPVKVSAKQILKEFSLPPIKAPQAPASAGVQGAPAPTATTGSSSQPATPPTPALAPASAGTQSPASTAAPSVRPAVHHPAARPAPAAPAIATPMVKERLFADPNRTASYAAGGDLQLRNPAAEITNFQNYFSDELHLTRNQYTLKPLRAGSIVIAGTILGRIGGPSQGLAPHVNFMVQPAGKNAPYIDAKPILDGWKLLEATAVYRAAGLDPFFGPDAHNPTVGQILLMSKEQLQLRVLEDPHVGIYACGKRDIAAGLIDRRVLATIEFLSASGLDPYVSGLECGHSLTGTSGTDAAGATGASVDITKINGIPVAGHQSPGSIVDIAIRRLLTLQGSMRPNEIVSDMAYRGQSNTLALPDHANRIQVVYTPLYGANRKLSGQIRSLLQPQQWIQLINHISSIPEPVVPIQPSKFAIRVGH